jgi:Ras-like without CAAX 1
LASQWDCPFFETSAALSFFVDDAFHELIREIRRKDDELTDSDKTKRKPKGKQVQQFFSHLFHKDKKHH